MAARAPDIPADLWDEGPGSTSTARSLWRFVRRYRAALGFGTAMLLIVIGWRQRDNMYLTAEEGLGYFLGIVAVLCMLVLLLYPLRKRWRFLRHLGGVKDFFRLHMTMGILGPVTALYHCNFQLGSLNSRIALFSALLVAGSGLIGRFIYTKIHHGLYGRRAELRELLAQVRLNGPKGVRAGTFVPELLERIAAFDRQVLHPPASWLEVMVGPFVLGIRTRIQYWQLMRFTRNRLIAEGTWSPEVAKHQDRLIETTRRYIASHLQAVRRVAEFSAYERLFSLWHKVHLPFFLLLVMSVVVHVIAVHIY
ncbi:MAG: hypothetical protein QNJ73_04755 [Gammaproteobacteria bacterium]|nr:hypothetical protein [Gammaproteobacteria bacterium]